MHENGAATADCKVLAAWGKLELAQVVEMTGLFTDPGSVLLKKPA